MQFSTKKVSSFFCLSLLYVVVQKRNVVLFRLNFFPNFICLTVKMMGFSYLYFQDLTTGCFLSDSLSYPEIPITSSLIELSHVRGKQAFCSTRMMKIKLFFPVFRSKVLQELYTIVGVWIWSTIIKIQNIHLILVMKWIVNVQES